MPPRYANHGVPDLYLDFAVFAQRGARGENLLTSRGVPRSFKPFNPVGKAHKSWADCHLSWTTLVTRVGFEVGEYFLCLGADFGGGGDLLAADLNGDVSQGT